MKLTGIYKITSPSGKIYIGQSIDLKTRISRYKSNLKSSKGQVKLHNSFCKYGAENHKFDIIELCLPKYLNNMERYYQEKFDAVNNGLNLRYTKSTDKSGKMSAESIAKMLVYKNNISSEHRAKMIENGKKRKVLPSMIGKKHTEETKLKISTSSKGKVKSKEHCTNISKSKSGAIVPIQVRIKKSKPVLQYDIQMNLIAEYYSCREATRQTGVHNGDLIACCKGKYKQAGGFIWRYKNS